MNAQTPLMIAVAPNGARKTRSDHPQLPITPAQLATTAAACLDAGACMLHLHVRDENDGHSLDTARYRAATQAIRQKVGDKLIIQITTEAVGLYKSAQQMQAVRDVRPEAVSLAIRELCPTAAEEVIAGEFFHWLSREHICPQYILYSVDDIKRCNDLQARGIIPQESINTLLVLGRYTDQQQSDPNDLLALLPEMNPKNSWALCAFGASEAKCMQTAIEHGGHCRVGFENNLLLPDGSTAPNNEALVRGVAAIATLANREIATAERARELLNKT